MMLRIERFINELMASNCYVVYNENTKQCIVIDPGSEKSLREIDFIDSKGLTLDFIFITHEHTDHTWGVNALREYYENSKLICSEICDKHIKKSNKAFFLLYYDDPNYRYEIAPADMFVVDGECFKWAGHQVKFIFTPGHSYGSVCIDIDGVLFTGDTIMPFKPYFNGRDSNEEDWKESIVKICSIYTKETFIYPGHGDKLKLKDWSNCII